MGLTVVQVLPALESGGVERGTLEVAAELVRQGHRSIVISAGGRMTEQLKRDGSEHVKWDIGRKSLLTFRYIFKLRKFLRENSVDILHARSRLPAWICYLAWKGMDKDKRPHFITTVHGQYSVSKYSSIMMYGERVIAVSRTIQDYITSNYPFVDQRKIRLIPRGVDPQEFPHGYKPEEAWLKTWQSQYSQLQNKIIITIAGRITRLKGHKDFIELINSLADKGYDIHGLIVGGTDAKHKQYENELRSIIADKNIKDKITFTGHRIDVREIFSVSDIVVSLTRKPESFGRTVLEALNLGTPVAGYAHGGVGEILSDLYPAGCVKPHDQMLLVNKVVDIIDGDVKVEEVKKYSLQSMLDNTISVYKEFV
ncbi:MAG: glycosyltransferase family 4 protein [Gammaproteobacteria bacterium]|nr:glycosyltransferase family 4 protein [Gammaproteobacteria bacterium]